MTFASVDDCVMLFIFGLGDEKLPEEEGGEKLPEETPTGKLIMPCTEKVLFFCLSLVK